MVYMRDMEDKTVHSYETVMIFRQDLTEELFNTKVDNFVRLTLSALAKRVVEVEKVGKKKLAYDIKDNEYGWYVYITYKCTSENIAIIEKELKKSTDVIKFITLKLTPGTLDEDEDEDEDDIYDKADFGENESEQIETKYKPDGYDILFGLEKI